MRDVSSTCLLASIVLWSCACTGKEVTVPDTAPSIAITSPDFAEGQAIPRSCTCQGDDTSPPLDWADVPSEARSLALIVDDPDAPMRTWVHWVIYDLPPTTKGLPAALPADESLAAGGTHGTNSWKRLGYGGPCPPSGTHRYFFKLYALDRELGLEPGATKDEVVAAMEGHVIAHGQLMGTYQKE